MLHWVLSFNEEISNKRYEQLKVCGCHITWTGPDLNQLLELSLDIVQASDIIPGDVGHLNNRLPQCRRVALAQGPLHIDSKQVLKEGPLSKHTHTHCSPSVLLYLEVIHSDSKRVHDFSINGLIFQVDQVHLLPDRLQRSLGAESSQICTNVAVGLISYLRTTGVWVRLTRMQTVLLRAA